MKLLMIVGTANDVFIFNLAKWLKKSMDVDIDIYEFYPSIKQNQRIETFASVYSSNTQKWFCRLWGIGYSIMQIYAGKQLSAFLKGKRYDYIHCHWLTASLVVNSNLKDYCSKLYVTFWGGEVFVQKLFFSHHIYMRRLKMLLDETDNIVGYYAEREFYENMFPQFKGKYLIANLAPTVLEELYRIMDEETKDESKTILNIPTDKKLVLIGYSGKEIHQHISIIKELVKKESLRNRICLLAPMTRGAQTDYINKVEKELNASGYKYVLYKDMFFTEEMMARLRNATDIVLQLSTRDSYSRSIIEGLCAKSVVIYGEWLNYDSFFAYDGFEAIKVDSIQNAVEKLCDVVNRISDYDSITYKNSVNGKTHNLWPECINDWVSIYKASNH